MCNCKGWDIAYYENEVTVVPHFCRYFDDCGHIDNTLEEAADEVASIYVGLTEWDKDESSTEGHLRLAQMWRDRTHPSYLFYKEQES